MGMNEVESAREKQFSMPAYSACHTNRAFASIDIHLHLQPATGHTVLPSANQSRRCDECPPWRQV